jgi:hypothetical protein
MKAATRLAIVVGLVAGASACGKGGGSAITGAVRDAWDKPLAGVTISTPDGKTATSGQDGTYRLVFGDKRPASITFTKPGWAVLVEERAAGPREGGGKATTIAIGPRSLVPAPPTEGLFVVGAAELAPLTAQPIEKLAVTPGPDGSPGKQLYKIAGAGFVKVPAGKLIVVARGGPAKLLYITVFERAPESYELSMTHLVTATPMQIAGGGEMVHHKGFGDLRPGRYILVADGDAELTRGYPITVE